MFEGTSRARTPGFAPPWAKKTRSVSAGLFLAMACAACGDDDSIWTAEEWDVSVVEEADDIIIRSTIADVHGDFIHMSIRRDGYSNRYTVLRSPAGGQPERDWSRVHYWFG